jgi:ferredoxin
MRTNTVTDRNRCALCGKLFIEGNRTPTYRKSRIAIFRLYKDESGELFIFKGTVDGKCVSCRPGADALKQYSPYKKEAPFNIDAYVK